MIVLLAVFVVIVMSIAFYVLAPGNKLIASKEGLTVEVLETKTFESVKVQRSYGPGTETKLYYTPDGYIYVMKLRVKNNAERIYAFNHGLVLDKGRGAHPAGCQVFDSNYPNYQELLSKAVELHETFLDVYGVSPKETVEYYVFFCVPRDAKIIKLVVMAIPYGAWDSVELSIDLS